MDKDEVCRLLTTAVAHLKYADDAYWDDEPEAVALHVGYAQAAALTATAMMQRITS